MIELIICYPPIFSIYFFVSLILVFSSRYYILKNNAYFRYRLCTDFCIHVAISYVVCSWEYCDLWWFYLFPISTSSNFMHMWPFWYVSVSRKIFYAACRLLGDSRYQGTIKNVHFHILIHSCLTLYLFWFTCVFWNICITIRIIHIIFAVFGASSLSSLLIIALIYSA